MSASIEDVIASKVVCWFTQIQYSGAKDHLRYTPIRLLVDAFTSRCELCAQINSHSKLIFHGVYACV